MGSIHWAYTLCPSIKEMSKCIITRNKENLALDELNISEWKKKLAQHEAIFASL